MVTIKPAVTEFFFVAFVGHNLSHFEYVRKVIAIDLYRYVIHTHALCTLNGLPWTIICMLGVRSRVLYVCVCLRS